MHSLDKRPTSSILVGPCCLIEECYRKRSNWGTRGQWYFRRSIVVRQRSLARIVDQVTCNDASRRAVDERTAHDFPKVRHQVDSQKLQWGAVPSQKRYAPEYGDDSADLQITTAFALADHRGKNEFQ